MTKLLEKLNQRGIYDVAHEFGWRPFNGSSKTANGQGWSYPIYEIDSELPYRSSKTGLEVHRWKNYDPEQQGGAKYGWVGHQDGCPPYYVLPGTKAAIEANHGLAYIAAGEIDVLTYHSAGFPNVISWLNGEGSVPKDLPQIAEQLGIRRFIYFIDRDQAGEASAKATAKRLADSSIEFIAYRLPAFLGDKGDINDLWKWVKFDLDQFAAELHKIVYDPTMEVDLTLTETIRPIQPSRPNPRKNAQMPINIDWMSEKQEWIRSEVVPQLNSVAPVVKHEGRQERRHCPNPQHRDEHPSFRISYDIDPDMGIPQCSCDIQHTAHPWDQVATWVGARPFMRWWQEERKQHAPTLSPQVFSSGENSDAVPQSPSHENSEVGWESDGIPLDELGASGIGYVRQPTDDEIGELLIGNWTNPRAYFYETWHMYSNGVWHKEASIDAEIWQAMIEAKAQGVKPNKSKAASIRDYLEAKLQVPSTQIDQAGYLINLANGLFNLDTYTLEPHRQEIYSTSQLEYEYIADAECPTWKQFLSQALVTREGQPDNDLIQLLQEAIGYSLTTDTSLEASFWLCGVAGSGKSTVLKVLQELLGTAFLFIDLSSLDDNRYQLADLPGKRVVAATEAKSRMRLADHMLKMLISGEEMVVRQIYQRSFSFKPTATVWWAMNDEPTNSDRSNAIYRRIEIIPFNYAVPEEKQDRHLIEKLRAERSGIFRWAVEGLQRLRAQGRFTSVSQVQTAVAEYKAQNDVEASFLQDIEWCILDATKRTQASDLYIAYSIWCERFNQEAMSNTKVAGQWERLSLTKVKNGYVQYIGVELTPAAKSLVADIRRVELHNIA